MSKGGAKNEWWRTRRRLRRELRFRFRFIGSSFHFVDHCRCSLHLLIEEGKAAYIDL